MQESQADWSWPQFVLLLLAEIWAAHAVVFFAHEYAHSFVAWALGWKSNPLALNYARPTALVFLLQSGIDQNVNELPIFAGGHGAQAAIISGAGAVIGNGLVSYSLSRWGYAVATRRGLRAWGMFAYWACVASIGNFVDYVPVRVFTDGTDLYQDMFAVEKGFGWSPWTLLVVFGIPTAFALAYFFWKIVPDTLLWLFPHSAGKRLLLVLLTVFALFYFYGAAGWSGVSPVAHRLSVISVTVIAPVMMIIAWLLVERGASGKGNSQPG